MSSKKNISKTIFFFAFNSKLELYLKRYINLRKNQEISGGLIGDIKGRKKNQIIFDIKQFFPFPNLAKNSRNFAMPPNFWFEIIEEWRTFYFKDYKFIGFLHTHPFSSSKLSNHDKNFANILREKYGTILFIIIGENKFLRCYLFKDKSISLISGELKFYKLIEK